MGDWVGGWVVGWVRGWVGVKSFSIDQLVLRVLVQFVSFQLESLGWALRKL